MMAKYVRELSFLPTYIINFITINHLHHFHHRFLIDVIIVESTVLKNILMVVTPVYSHNTITLI